MTWQHYSLIFLGGGLGALLRFTFGHLLRSQSWTNTFPWHTFLINVVGSFTLGLLAGLVKDRHSLTFVFVGTGLCGGFTTFSAFSLETVELLEAQRWLAVGGYVAGSVLAAVLGCAGGLHLARLG